MAGPEYASASLDRTGHLGASELGAFLDGNLEPAERRRIEIHLDACAECRREMVAIRQITSPYRKTPLGRIRRARRWWVPAALAAALGGLVLLPRVVTRRPPAAPVRAAPGADGEGTRRIGTVTPADDATVDPDRIVFTWHSAGTDLYRVSLLTETAGRVWTGETGDTTLVLPDSVPVQRGQPYFWRVEAVGIGITATTGVHQVRIAP